MRNYWLRQLSEVVNATPAKSIAAWDAFGSDREVLKTDPNPPTVPDVSVDRVSAGKVPSEKIVDLTEDWRLMGQESYLSGATLQKKRYCPWSETWFHDHCSFCFTKICNPEFDKENHDHSDASLSVAFAAAGTGPNGEDDYHWVCPTCAADFRTLFNWTLVDEGVPPLSNSYLPTESA